MSMSKESRYFFGGIFIVVVVMLLFTCGNAAASPGDDGCVGNCDDGTTGTNPVTVTTNTAVLNTNTNLNANVSENSNRNTNTNKNTNKATGTGYGGNSTSSANATGGNSAAFASNGPQTTAVAINNRTPSSLRTVGIAPDLSSYSTAPCRIAVGASGGWMGGALGFSGSVLDEGCDVWRDHVNLRLAGYVEQADLRLCDKPELKKLFGDKCKSMVAESEPSLSSFSVH
jgi:hypothetical protein